MDVLVFLQTNTPVFLVFALLIGLSVGSFLNVVIHRFPLMMKRRWRGDCLEFLREEGGIKELPGDDDSPALTLARPASRCPHCGHRISALENIPLLSYLVLRGKCRACGASISMRYPAVELLTGLLCLTVAWYFGVSWAALWGIVFTCTLIALSFIDYDTRFLPDEMTLPLLWLGLLINTQGVFTDLLSAVIGAAAGYLTLWTVYQVFKLVTGKEGMGFGDFKLLAALGAWMGWQALPAIILLSSLVGAVIGIGLIVLRGRDRSLPIPFGPYLAIAGWIFFMWGEAINNAWLDWAAAT